MSDQDNNGFLEAHTPPAAGEKSPSADAADLGGADPADLLAGLPEDQAIDALELVAEKSLSQRRAAGRPKGAANRKNSDLIAYLAARGHRDPWVTLSLIQSADFKELCVLVGATKGKEKMAVMKLQLQAAADIMPYHHSRKPQQLELPATDKRPLMVIGEMNVNHISQDGTMSAGVMIDQDQQNQEVSEAETVRENVPTNETPLSD